MPHAQAEAIAPHVWYEWTRFQVAAQRIAFSQSVSDGHGEELYLEAFLQHARNLFHFLTRKSGRAGDVFAIHFIELWDASEDEMPYLKEHAKRLDRSIQHLTYHRLEYGRDRDWKIGTLYPEMKAVWDRFWASLTPDQQKWFPRPIDPV